MIFKELSPQDFRVVPSVGEQTVEISQQDIANSANRRRYMTYYAATDVDPNDQPSDPVAAELVGTTRQVVTGTYQTVYDMDHTNQYSNPLMDISVGIYPEHESEDYDAPPPGTTISPEHEFVDYKTSFFDKVDSRGKALWKDGALQMNEKIDVYRQMAQKLLEDPDLPFTYYDPVTNANREIASALFLTFRRSVMRDGLSPGSFAMRVYRTLKRTVDSQSGLGSIDPYFPYWQGQHLSNMTSSLISDGECILIDKPDSPHSGVGGIFLTREDGVSVPPSPQGIIFYNLGVVVLDLKNIIEEAPLGGIIASLEDNDMGRSGYYDQPSTYNEFHGTDVDLLSMADPFSPRVVNVSKRTFSPHFPGAVYFESFMAKASIDDILDHIASTRFISDPDSDLTAITFKSKVRTQSMIIHCRVAPEDFNYSNNPTYTDEDGNIVARDSDTKPFSYVTKIVLLDASNRILATAALSRPLFNDSETDQSFRIRLDY